MQPLKWTDRLHPARGWLFTCYVIPGPLVHTTHMPVEVAGPAEAHTTHIAHVIPSPLVHTTHMLSEAAGLAKAFLAYFAWVMYGPTRHIAP